MSLLEADHCGKKAFVTPEQFGMLRPLGFDLGFAPAFAFWFTGLFGLTLPAFLVLLTDLHFFLVNDLVNKCLVIKVRGKFPLGRKRYHIACCQVFQPVQGVHRYNSRAGYACLPGDLLYSITLFQSILLNGKSLSFGNGSQVIQENILAP